MNNLRNEINLKDSDLYCTTCEQTKLLTTRRKKNIF